MIISLPNSRWFYRLINVALIALIAWFAAGLLWLIFAPAPVPPAAAPMPSAKGTKLDVGPLTALLAAPAGPADADAASTLPQKLRGVIAAHDDAPAAAIFEGGTPQNSAVQVGGELSPGVRLVEVSGDHVIVDNQGRRERLELESKPAANIENLGSGPAPADPVSSGLITPPPPPLPHPSHIRPPKPSPTAWNTQKQTIQEQSVTRQAVDASWKGLHKQNLAQGVSESTDGARGVVVQDVSNQPLLSLLNLQAGDVLQTVNGRPLSKATDISALYAALRRNPLVNVDVVRNGTQLTMHYRIQS